jgi:hypothetical protein
MRTSSPWARRRPSGRAGADVKKTHLGLGVILIMSLKGTATLTAAFLLPTWPARIIALVVIALIIIVSIVMHRRKKKRQAQPQ